MYTEKEINQREDDPKMNQQRGHQKERGDRGEKSSKNKDAREKEAVEQRRKLMTVPLSVVNNHHYYTTLLKRPPVPSVKSSEFDWDAYPSKKGKSRQFNKTVLTTGNTKVYNFESSAQMVYDMYELSKAPIVSKDFTKGDVINVVSANYLGDYQLVLHLVNGTSQTIDIRKESKFAHIIGFNTVSEFEQYLSERPYQLSQDVDNMAICVESVFPSPKVSLYGGYITNVKRDFIKQIKTPSAFYMADIISANRGGYFVKVQGVDAWLPGSLAGPNIITNFEALIGTCREVMIESYVDKTDTFIVSHKKYIQHTISSRLDDLDFDREYNCIVTGVTKFGIFLELEEFFTGLLHITKFGPTTQKKFSHSEIKSGDVMTVKLDSIDNKTNKITFVDADYVAPVKEEKENTSN